MTWKGHNTTDGALKYSPSAESPEKDMSSRCVRCILMCTCNHSSVEEGVRTSLIPEQSNPKERVFSAAGQRAAHSCFCSEESQCGIKHCPSTRKESLHHSSQKGPVTLSWLPCTAGWIAVAANSHTWSWLHEKQSHAAARMAGTLPVPLYYHLPAWSDGAAEECRRGGQAETCAVQTQPWAALDHAESRCKRAHLH